MEQVTQELGSLDGSCAFIQCWSSGIFHSYKITSCLLLYLVLISPLLPSSSRSILCCVALLFRSINSASTPRAEHTLFCCFLLAREFCPNAMLSKHARFLLAASSIFFPGFVNIFLSKMSVNLFQYFLSTSLRMQPSVVLGGASFSSPSGKIPNALLSLIFISIGLSSFFLQMAGSLSVSLWHLESTSAA